MSPAGFACRADILQPTFSHRTWPGEIVFSLLRSYILSSGRTTMAFMQSSSRAQSMNSDDGDARGADSAAAWADGKVAVARSSRRRLLSEPRGDATSGYGSVSACRPASRGAYAVVFKRSEIGCQEVASGARLLVLLCVSVVKCGYISAFCCKGPARDKSQLRPGHLSSLTDKVHCAHATFAVSVIPLLAFQYSAVQPFGRGLALDRGCRQMRVAVPTHQLGRGDGSHARQEKE